MIKQIIKITLSLLIIVASFTSCVDDKNFETPQITENDTDISNTPLSVIKSSILQSLSLVSTNPDIPDSSTLIHTFPELNANEDNKIIVAAYVVGDDTTGNFYKKLIVQDSPENPTFGLEIRIDAGNLHTIYNVGRKIYIQLNGLTATYLDGSQGGAPSYPNQSIPDGHADINYNNIPGVYKLGVLGEDFYVDRISGLDYEKIITRSSVSETIVPSLISTNDISDATMNTAVEFNNMQFEFNELGKTYAGEANDAYDASRFLINCETEYVFGLMTSTFSNFKYLAISDKKGSVKGVLMKNFRESEPVVVLNSPNDVNFTETDRCDPIFLDCGTASTAGTTDLMVENFDGGIPATWTNYIQAGSESWETFSGSNALSGQSVRMGSYQSNDESSIGWLISPAINMDAQTGETLEFQTSNSYSDGSKLELMYSNDWDGTEAGIANANWGLLTAATIVSDDEYYQNWVSSGVVDLSCAEGTNFYLAFKYTGSGSSDFDGTYELDEVAIKF